MKIAHQNALKETVLDLIEVLFNSPSTRFMSFQVKISSRN